MSSVAAFRADETTRTSRTFGAGVWSTFVIAFAVTFALATLWALASPIFSVPDENAHAAKAIAQLRGEVIGHTVPGIRHLVVDLPDGYQYSPQLLCFATHPEQPASCGVELGDASGALWFNTWVGAYNPLYYYAVGWPTLLLKGSAGIYGMRIVSALLGALFVALAFQLAAAAPRSRWMPLGVAFALMPMSAYLLGSVNPNGIEIAAAVALWMGLLRLLQSFDARDTTVGLAVPRWYLWLVVTLASVVLATARALGPLWLLVVVLLCFLVIGWRPVKALFATAASYRWLGIVAAGGLFSIFWTLRGGSLSSQAEKSDAPLVGESFVHGFAYVIRATPDFLTQALGYFGWFDAPLPAGAFWIAVSAIAVFLMLAFVSIGRRSALSLASVAIAAFLVPALVQGYSVSQTGIIWQGRYGLFLYLGVMIVAGWVLSGADARGIAHLSIRVTWVVATLLAVFGLLAYIVVMQRYVIGDSVPISAMWKNPAWQPPLGWPALVALYFLTSAAFVALVGRMGMRAAKIDQRD